VRTPQLIACRASQDAPHRANGGGPTISIVECEERTARILAARLQGEAAACGEPRLFAFDGLSVRKVYCWWT
jgi:hypothetical protein